MKECYCMTVKCVLYKGMMKVVTSLTHGEEPLEYIPNSDERHAIVYDPIFNPPHAVIEEAYDYDDDEVDKVTLYIAPNVWHKYELDMDAEDLFGFNNVEYGFDGILYEGE